LGLTCAAADELPQNAAEILSSVLCTLFVLREHCPQQPIKTVFECKTFIASQHIDTIKSISYIIGKRKSQEAKLL